MLKRSFLLFLVLFLTFSFAGEFDKDIVVKNQSRNDKVKTVFREMMNAYEEEDIGQFFSFVSEDRFQQDYMTFYDAIDEDIRIYDILSVDTWVNKITEDGVKRFLYVQWEKRYLTTSSDKEINQRGYSRFLFDEVNGKYKLIQLAGNNFWGKSLREWREEVPEIAGQEPEKTVEGTPDLIVDILDCSGGNIYFELKNIGTGATTAGNINYEVYDGSIPITTTYAYSNDIPAGASSGNLSQPHNCDAVYGGYITVDVDDMIDESDETNNQSSIQ